MTARLQFLEAVTAKIMDDDPQSVLQVGDLVLRVKSERDGDCYVVEVDRSEDPPSYVVKHLSTGSYYKCEREHLIRYRKAPPNRWRNNDSPNKAPQSVDSFKLSDSSGSKSSAAMERQEFPNDPWLGKSLPDTSKPLKTQIKEQADSAWEGYNAPPASQPAYTVTSGDTSQRRWVEIPNSGGKASKNTRLTIYLREEER